MPSGNTTLQARDEFHRRLVSAALESIRDTPNLPRRTDLLHNGVMRRVNTPVRQSVTLPANIAAQVRRLAKEQRLSANRMLLELIRNRMQAEKRKQEEFLDLARRFRNATDPAEVDRLGGRMGRMVFGN